MRTSMLDKAAPVLGIVLAGAILAGCDDVAPAAGNDPEAQARAVCVRDVRATTGNPEVSVLSSEFSQAGTRVLLRVGPEGTWQCDAYLNGTTANIMSLTDEGSA